MILPNICRSGKTEIVSWFWDRLLLSFTPFSTASLPSYPCVPHTSFPASILPTVVPALGTEKRVRECGREKQTTLPPTAAEARESRSLGQKHSLAIAGILGGKVVTTHSSPHMHPLPSKVKSIHREKYYSCITEQSPYTGQWLLLLPFSQASRDLIMYSNFHGIIKVKSFFLHCQNS